MNKAQLIHQDSGNTEWYTPPEIIEAARRVLGQIDLDPASSEAANKWVKAGKIFTIDDDGLTQEWFGKVWMNHPFGTKENPTWINKYIGEFMNDNVEEACNITYAATSEKWFQPLACWPQCYLHPRTNYLLPNGTKKPGVTKGSVVTYLGCDVEKFAREFRPFGTVKVAV